MSEYHEDWARAEMRSAVDELRQAVVGHKVTSHSHDGENVEITLDSGRVVYLNSEADCCAYSEVQKVVRRLQSLDHIVTDVRTDDDIETWSILCEAGALLDIEVEWSESNGYYAFVIQVEVKEPAR